MEDDKEDQAQAEKREADTPLSSRDSSRSATLCIGWNMGKLAPVSHDEARLIRSFSRQGYSREDIARMLGRHLSSVRRVLRHYRKHGEDRVPRQGKGRLNDVRWVFAGPHKDAALRELQRIKDAGDDADRGDRPLVGCRDR